jgi:tetratricopeptide (TPR) repeat protein
MPRRAQVAALLTLSVLGGGAGCAIPKLIYTPDELRAEVARRAPDVPREEIVAPYEIDPEHTAMARQAVAQGRTDTERTKALVAAFFDSGKFHLRYSWGVTATAEETLRSSEGNCLSLASVFVGLARAAGLQAYYIDASTRVHETRYQENWTVNTGHVTAMVMAEGERIGLDFGNMGPIRWYRIIDDLEALAHFYNNRGFEVVEKSQEGGAPADWNRASHDFWLAVQVMPGFARAWNNLGIAAVHLGRVDEAIVDYRSAIDADPLMAAPRNNLGSLYLEQGRVDEAIEALEAASRLDPDGSHIQYNLALARVRVGDRGGAVRALQRAIHLRGHYPEAQAMLDGLAAVRPGM